jgi:hypothetical protein
MIGVNLSIYNEISTELSSRDFFLPTLLTKKCTLLTKYKLLNTYFMSYTVIFLLN